LDAYIKYLVDSKEVKKAEDALPTAQQRIRSETMSRKGRKSMAAVNFNFDDIEKEIDNEQQGTVRARKSSRPTSVFSDFDFSNAKRASSANQR
jgi:hypothetical protein